jgi:hypothetical protein
MTCGRIEWAYLYATITSILFTTIFSIFGVGVLGVSKIGEVEGEIVPCV